ncbi:MAG: ABC transporter permease [Chloroflexota bacterium]
MYLKRGASHRTVIEAVDPISIYSSPKQFARQIMARFYDIVSYRDLLWNLVLRDLKLRYKNSALGILWSLLNPLLMMIVFTAVFTVMRGTSIDDFPAFVLVGLLPWQFFNDSISGSTTSIVGNSHLINKVYFPREILVISGVLSNLVNFLIALTLLVPILLWFNIGFTEWALLLPFMIIIQIIFTLGVSFIVATTNVYYRDVGMIVAVALLAGFFLTPIFYPLEELPRSYMLFGIDWDIWTIMYYLNPMASIIENYRRILYYAQPHDILFILRTLLTAVFFLIAGLAIFYRYNDKFGEIV